MTGPPSRFQLLETMAYLPQTGVRNEAAHVDRLISSADCFGFRLDEQNLRTTLHGSLAGVSLSRRVRLVVQPDGGVSVDLGSMPAASTAPVRLAVDTDPVSSQSVWRFHKTSQREAYDARAARHPYADDVVLVNEHGQVTETTIANLVVRLDGTWFTPPVQCGCLPGVERGRLVREGRLTERVLTVADLRANQGLALVSSLRGWRRASLVESSGSGAP